MTSLVTDYGKLKAAGADIVAISVDDPEKSRTFANNLKIPFTVLSDADHKVIEAYDVLDAENKISKPAVFIVDKKGIVRWSYIGTDRADRPLNEKILAELGKID